MKRKSKASKTTYQLPSKYRIPKAKNGFWSGLKDVGQAALDSALTPAEALAGDFYQPEYETGFGDVADKVNKAVDKTMYQVAPAAAGIAATALTGSPQAGQAVSQGTKLAQGVATDLAQEGDEEEQQVPQFKHGGMPQNLIEVEGQELETQSGKITQDFAKYPSHTKGGFTYNAKPNRTIIPSKLRNYYLEGDKSTRLDLETNVIDDHLQRMSIAGGNEKDKVKTDTTDKFVKKGTIVVPKPTSEAEVLEYRKKLANAKKAGYIVESQNNDTMRRSGKFTDTPTYEQGGTTNFKSSAAYRRWLAYGHASGKFASTPGHQKVSIQGQPKNVKHAQDGMPTSTNYMEPIDTPFNQLNSETTNIFDTPPAVTPRQRAQEAIAYDNQLKASQSSDSQVGNKLTEGAYYGAMAAPIAYNLYRGIFQKPTTLKHEEFQNPEYNRVKQLMAARKINMKPVADEIRDTYRIGLANVGKGAKSSGQVLSGQTSLWAARMNALAKAEMEAQDYNNRYRGEEASTVGALGDRWSDRKLGIEDMNLRSRAARNAHLRQATMDVSELAQGLNRDDILYTIAGQAYPDYQYNRRFGANRGWKYRSYPK